MELETYQKVADTTLRWLSLDKVVKVKVLIRDDIDSGRGYFDRKEIHMPAWISSCDPGYRLYYVLHELIHCLIGYKHNQTFKQVEDTILDLWDIKIKRKRVYPKQMFWHDKEILNIPAQHKMSYLTNKEATNEKSTKDDSNYNKCSTQDNFW